MTFLELLRRRRSIRAFTPRPVEPSLLEALQEALLRSPTSRGLNPWHFILVTDRIVLDQLSKSKKAGSSFLRSAPAAVVVCGDESVSDVWVEDCSIAAITMQYQLEELGLGSCWIQIRNRQSGDERSSDQFVRELLGLPPTVRAASIIAFGYPDEAPEPHPASAPAPLHWHQERW